jgi:uncharacterized protein (TIGR02145 family)
MQEMTPTICGNMELYSSMKLRDDRGAVPQFYRVRKMPDSKCWMIDNLKLELTNGMQLQPADTNVSSPTTVTLSGSGTYTGNFITSGDMGFDYWAQANPSDPMQLGTESCVAGHMVDPASATGCGYLYNWYTATASSGTYAMEGGYAVSSICPSSWHLPRGNDGTANENEFAVLNAKMDDPDAVSVLVSGNFDTIYAKNWWHTGLFAGSRSAYYNSGFVYQGYSGQFWSSSAYSLGSAGDLGFSHTRVSTAASHSGKQAGFAVRCVFS